MKNIHSDGGILKGYQASLVVQLVKKRRPWFGSLVGKVPWRIDRLPAHISLDFPGGLDGRTSACNAGDLAVRDFLWRKTWQPTPVFLPGECPWAEESGGL